MVSKSIHYNASIHYSERCSCFFKPMEIFAIRTRKSSLDKIGIVPFEVQKTAPVSIQCITITHAVVPRNGLLFLKKNPTIAKLVSRMKNCVADRHGTVCIEKELRER